MTKVLLFLIFIQFSYSAIISRMPNTNYSEINYSTIPMPLDGWLDKSEIKNIQCLSLEDSKSNFVEGKCGLYIFDHTRIEFEPFVRQIQNEYKPGVCVFRSPRRAGRAFVMTDGKLFTSDLYIPTIELSEHNFDEFSNYVANNPYQLYNISFFEPNYFFYVNYSPHLQIMLSFPTSLSLFGILWGIRNLYYHVKYHLPFNNSYIALILEIIGNIFRFLYCMDYNGTRRLVPNKLSRALVSLHIPFSLSTSFLVVLYAGYLISKTKQGKKAKPFIKATWVKIAFIFVIITMGFIEFVGLIGTFTMLEFYFVWNIFSVVIYMIISIISTISFSITAFMSVRIMKIKLFEAHNYVDDTIESKVKYLIYKLVRRTILAGIGYFMVSLSLILTLLSILIHDDLSNILYGKYIPYFGLMGILMASLTHIHTYDPHNRIDRFKISKDTTSTMGNTTQKLSTDYPKTSMSSSN